MSPSPPTEPTKNAEDFAEERAAEVRWLERHGYLWSERLKAALLAVPHERFVSRDYRDYAYREVPLPLPGEEATVSCPHSHPLFCEPLGMDCGHRVLEVGAGSGYGAAVAREVVGDGGLVVTVEINAETLRFARDNLEHARYHDVKVVYGDGGLGWSESAPHDCIAATAACAGVPPPLIDQLAPDGRLIAPVLADRDQDLLLVRKRDEGIEMTTLCKVLYVSLRGTYGQRAFGASSQF